MIELKHLRTLATLRDVGSLSGAAERLHLSVSALSHQLTELESRLGGLLFLRKSKPLQFTREGLWCLELADECLPRVDAVLSRFARSPRRYAWRSSVIAVFTGWPRRSRGVPPLRDGKSSL